LAIIAKIGGASSALEFAEAPLRASPREGSTLKTGLWTGSRATFVDVQPVRDPPDVKLESPSGLQERPVTS